MKKTVFLLVFSLLSFVSKGFEVKIVHSPEIKSPASGVVIIPSENTPYEFAGYIEERVKESTGLEVINREAFSDFLKREGIGKKGIISRDLIKIYKAFGSIDLIFLDLKQLGIKKEDLNGKTPCKRGEIRFEFKVFHSRDGMVLNKRVVEFEATVCSKTPLYPETKEVIKLLFENSSNEVLKTIWPWSEVINFPEPEKNTCKTTEIIKKMIKNQLDECERLIKVNMQCLNKNPFNLYLLRGYLEFFKGDFEKSVDLLSRALTFKKENADLSRLVSRVRGIEKKTILGMMIIRQKKEKKPQIQNQQDYYVHQYKNSGDILLEKLAELEELYKSGKITKEEYMKRKYQLIEQF